MPATATGRVYGRPRYSAPSVRNLCRGVSADSEPPRMGRIMPMLNPSRSDATISSATHTNRRHRIMEYR